VLNAAGLPVIPSEAHVVPVMVGNPEMCKEAGGLLLSEHGIYVQPINYSTVPRGTECLRIRRRLDPPGGTDDFSSRLLARAAPANARRRPNAELNGHTGRFSNLSNYVLFLNMYMLNSIWVRDFSALFTSP
jgi:hypothetical protein